MIEYSAIVSFHFQDIYFYEGESIEHKLKRRLEMFKESKRKRPNPEVKSLSTSLKVLPGTSLDKAYNQSGYFRAETILKGDNVTIIFERPLELSRYVFLK